jgi:hypothetical protein
MQIQTLRHPRSVNTGSLDTIINMATRQSTRQTSLMQRSAGGCIDALEFVRQRNKKGAGVVFLGLGAALLGGADDALGKLLLVVGTLCLGAVICSNKLHGSKRPLLCKRLDGEKWQIKHFCDAEVHQRFGFDSTAELVRVHAALKWPLRIKCGRGQPSKQYMIDGEQPFLYMLERDHCATKYSLLEFWAGDSHNSICEQALAAERWMVEAHKFRLLNLAFFVPRFPSYAAAIRRRIEHNGDAVPPEALRIMGFLDRCSVRICKPAGNWAFQHLFHSFKSQYHCLAYQSCVAPDGMHMHMWGPKAGKHNDRLLLGQSGFNALMENLQRRPDGTLPPLNELYSAYTDRGYDSHTCVRTAHSGPLTTAQQIMWNNVLSPVRVCVEWGFARIRAMSKLLHSSWNMLLQGTAVDTHVKSAVILANAHTTLRGAQGVKYFTITPPTLEQYFA